MWSASLVALGLRRKVSRQLLAAVEPVIVYKHVDLSLRHAINQRNARREPCANRSVGNTSDALLPVRNCNSFPDCV